VPVVSGGKRVACCAASIMPGYRAIALMPARVGTNAATDHRVRAADGSDRHR
jgi:hypothetical protein